MLSKLKRVGQDSTTAERDGIKSILSTGSFGKYSKLAYTQNSSQVPWLVSGAGLFRKIPRCVLSKFYSFNSLIFSNWKYTKGVIQLQLLVLPGSPTAGLFSSLPRLSIRRLVDWWDCAVDIILHSLFKFANYIRVLVTEVIAFVRISG